MSHRLAWAQQRNGVSTRCSWLGDSYPVAPLLPLLSPELGDADGGVGGGVLGAGGVGRSDATPSRLRVSVCGRGCCAL